MLSQFEFFEWRSAPAAEFAVIGNPINHSMSPQMFEAAFKHQHLSFKYHRILVPENEFEQALDHLAQLGYVGLNVTLPLKELAYAWAGTLEIEAESAKAANCVRLLDCAAHNTDIAGIKSIFNKQKIAGKSGLILGYGGAAKGAISALSAEYDLTLWARNPLIANEIPQNVKFLTHLSFSGFDFIINATSAFRTGPGFPMPISEAKMDAVIIDLDYSTTGETPFLLNFPEEMTKIDGRSMLVKQGALAFRWWTDIELNEAVMMGALCP